MFPDRSIVHYEGGDGEHTNAMVRAIRDSRLAFPEEGAHSPATALLSDLESGL